MKVATLLAVLLLAFSASDARAWGFSTHMTICDAAYDQLDQNVKKFVLNLSGSRQAFVESCVWADDVRKTTHRPSYEYHFINLKRPEDGLDLRTDCEAEDCATIAIKRYSVYLRNYARKLASNSHIGTREKNNAVEGLKFLGHFVGDLHQPLHVGRASDTGGNDVTITWTRRLPRNRRVVESTNLHSFWDSNLPTLAKIQKASVLEMINNTDVSDFENNDLRSWARESWEVARDVAYDIPADKKITDAYITRAVPKVEEQVMKAAVRLAHLLRQCHAGTLTF